MMRKNNAKRGDMVEEGVERTRQFWEGVDSYLMHGESADCPHLWGDRRVRWWAGYYRARCARFVPLPEEPPEYMEGS